MKLQRHISLVTKDREWGTALEVTFCALLFKIEIEVFSRVTNGFAPTVNNLKELYPGKIKCVPRFTVQIAHVNQNNYHQVAGQNHYVFLRRMNLLLTIHQKLNRQNALNELANLRGVAFAEFKAHVLREIGLVRNAPVNDPANQHSGAKRKSQGDPSASQNNDDEKGVMPPQVKDDASCASRAKRAKTVAARKKVPNAQPGKKRPLTIPNDAPSNGVPKKRAKSANNARNKWTTPARKKSKSSANGASQFGSWSLKTHRAARRKSKAQSKPKHAPMNLTLSMRTNRSSARQTRQ